RCGDQEVPRSRFTRMGRADAQLRMGDQRGLRPQAYRMDDRLRRLGRRYRPGAQADVRAGGEPKARPRGRDGRGRPRDHRQLSRLGVGWRLLVAAVCRRPRTDAMTNDQKIVAVGAASGIVTMTIAMATIYRLWPVDPTLTDVASRLAYALKADVVAV